MKRIVITAGGTGGHIFPALSLAIELHKVHDYDVHFITDQRGEKFLRGKTLFTVQNIFKMPWVGYLPGVLWQMLKNLHYFYKHPAKLVIGFGGYPSVPIVGAAQFLNIPTIIHEQNAILGRANRLLASKAKFIAMGANLHNPPSNAVLTGIPVRKEIINARKNYVSPQKGEEFRVLVLGGSQGAKLFSADLPEILSHLPNKFRSKLKITTQSRPENLEDTILAYKRAGIDAIVRPFFENVGELISHSHLVITRAGASSLAEIATLAVPAILIPFAAAIEQDQLKNTHILCPGAEVLLEKQLPQINELLLHYWINPEVLQNKSAILRNHDHSSAVQKLSQLVKEIVPIKHDESFRHAYSA